MLNITDDCVISYYVNQFGVISSRGKAYLKQLLSAYVHSGFQPDYPEFIAALGRRKGVEPESVRRSIRRFVQTSWKAGFAREWQYFTGWDRGVPPSTDAAVQLVCENYFLFFIRNRELLERRDGSFVPYYLMAEAKALEERRGGGEDPHEFPETGQPKGKSSQKE